MTDSTQNWAAVPVRVRELYVKHAHDACLLVRGAANHPDGWVLDTEVGPVFVKRAAVADTGAALGASALSAGKGGLEHIGPAWRGAQKFMGGPNPLTAMLLTGALTGGLGYGAGYLMHKLFPNAVSRNAKNRWGIGAGLVGAAGSGALNVPYALEHDGIMGMFKAQPLQGNPGPLESWLTSKPEPPASRFDAELDKAAADFGVAVDNDTFLKHAQPSMAGGFLPSVPTDEWGRVVFRDPYLSDREKAISAGLPAAAGAMRGSDMVSPRDIAKVAVNAGLGYGYGSLGGLAARFLGFAEPVQVGLQRAGLLAGAIRGITGML